MLEDTDMSGSSTGETTPPVIQVLLQTQLIHNEEQHDVLNNVTMHVHVQCKLYTVEPG